MHQILETKLNNFKELFEIDGFFLSPFIFRGQGNSKWDLKTSIERTIENYSFFNYEKTCGYETQEKWMIIDFKKKYPLYSNKLPDIENNFEWLSIMQHYGAPTRLLDFSSSIFVALYFATIESKIESSIWCLNKIQIRDNLHSKFQLDYTPKVDLKDKIDKVHIDLANQFIANESGFKTNNKKTLIPLEPNFYTERLSKQQGLFLMPSESKTSFTENMLSTFNMNELNFDKIDIEDLIKLSIEKSLHHKINILKINIDEGMSYDIVNYLKEMNITAETLFSGIEGLAKSLIQSHIRT